MVGIIEQYVLDNKDFLIISNLLFTYSELLDRRIKRHTEANPKVDFSLARKRVMLAREYAKKLKSFG